MHGLTWEKIQTGILYKNTMGLLQKGYLTTIKPRSKEIVIGRLRIQSCSLNAYLFKLGLHESGFCENCNTPETVEHVILQCPKNQSLTFNLKSCCKALKIPFN